jgi:hypothetical protein
MNQSSIMLAEASYLSVLPFWRVSNAIVGNRDPSSPHQAIILVCWMLSYQHRIELISVEPQPASGGRSLRLADETFPHRAGLRTWLDPPGRL